MCAAHMKVPAPSDYVKKDIIPKMLQMRFDYAFAILQSGGRQPKHRRRRNDLSVKSLRKAMSKLGVDLSKEDAAEMIAEVQGNGPGRTSTDPKKFLALFRHNMVEFDEAGKKEDMEEDDAPKLPKLSPQRKHNSSMGSSSTPHRTPTRDRPRPSPSPGSPLAGARVPGRMEEFYHCESPNRGRGSPQSERRQRKERRSFDGILGERSASALETAKLSSSLRRRRAP